MEPILEIINTSENGGAEKAASLIIKKFARKGIKIFFVFPPGPYAKNFRKLEKYGVVCIELPLNKSHLIKSIKSIRKTILENNIKYIHSHQYHADFFSSIASIGVKGVYRLSTVHYIFKYAPYGILRKFIMYICFFYSFRKMDKIFALSKAAKCITAKTFLLSKKKISVIYNSIDPEEMSVSDSISQNLRAKYKKNQSTIILLCAGLFHPHKGQENIIKAFISKVVHYKNINLILLGDGEEKEKFQKIINDNNLQNRIFLPGYVTNINDWYNIADIYIQPSIKDNMPNSILEAMYFKLPVIASNLPTFADVVKNKINALSVKPGCPEEIADAIIYLTNNPEKRIEMARKGFEFVNKYCTIDKMMEKIISYPLKN